MSTLPFVDARSAARRTRCAVSTAYLEDLLHQLDPPSLRQLAQKLPASRRPGAPPCRRARTRAAALRSSGGSTSLPVISRSTPNMRSASSIASASAGSVVVVDRRYAAGVERPALGELVEVEALTALDEDVEPAVLEPRQHLDDSRTRSHVADPLVVGVDEPELRLGLEALADQLLVALLEDVKRQLLGRQEDDAEREQSELVHGESLCGRGRQAVCSRSSAHELMQ